MKLTLFTILLMGLCSCSSKDNQTEIVNVQAEQLIKLTNNSKSGLVYGLKITGVGSIDGNATITLVLNGKPYKTEHLAGNIKFGWGSDWYSDYADIIYKPNAVKSGSITISYEFSTPE